MQRTHRRLPLPRLSLPILVAAAWLTATAPAAAQPEKANDPPSGLRLAEPELQARDGGGWIHGLGAASAEKSAQGRWEMLWDLEAEMPHLLQGSGLALEDLPGPGGASSKKVGARGPWTRAELEPRLRALIESMPQLAWWRGAAMRWNSERSLDAGGVWFVEFEQRHRGVPVLGARAVFRISAGRIIQIGLEGLAPVERSATPRLPWPEAAARAAEELSLAPEDLPNEAELALRRASLSRSAPPSERHRLVWRTFLYSSKDGETYRLTVDADTGRGLELAPLRYRGEAFGAVHLSAELPPTKIGMPWVEVWNDSGLRVTDDMGLFEGLTGTSEAELRGPRVGIRDLCGPTKVSSTDGQLDFGAHAGTDCETSGTGGSGNTQAARDTYYHLSHGVEQALGYLPWGGELPPLAAITNDEDTACSASWNEASRTMTFGRSSAECRNPGEVPGLIAHEMGHALDSYFGGLSSFGSGSEATADVVALLYTEDGCVARGLRPGIPCHNCSPTCSGVRDLDRFSAGLGTAARPDTLADPGLVDCGRLGCPFPGGPTRTGPLGYQAHCESYLASTAIRDLIDMQSQVVGPEQAWEDVRRLWFKGMPAMGEPYRLRPTAPLCSESMSAIDGCSLDSWYHVLLAADDDDGDLDNGTPNACRIWQAFAKHGLACGGSKDCSCSSRASQADAGPDRTICRGERVTIGVPPVEGTSYSWIPGGLTTAQITVSPESTTTYYQRAISACGQSDDSVTVTVRSCDLDGEFDQGGAGWSRDGLWHAVPSPSCAPPSPGTSGAMYFGQILGCQFGDGTTAFGDLISPPIPLDSTTPNAVKFSYYLQVDDQRPRRDRAELAISIDQGPWIPRWAASSSDALEATWHESPTLSVPPSAGQSIRLRFRFDSVDAEHNDGYGWLVDGVRMVNEAPPTTNAAPKIQAIESPPASQSECACVSCLFTASDDEDGDLSHLLIWSSDIDGYLGVGTRLLTVLSPGDHVLTAVVVDSGGAAAFETL
ncbi:MAG: hypothetical protein AAF725_10085, partial [Acidobacteriota bacterium]